MNILFAIDLHIEAGKVADIMFMRLKKLGEWALVRDIDYVVFGGDIFASPWAGGTTTEATHAVLKHAFETRVVFAIAGNRDISRDTPPVDTSLDYLFWAGSVRRLSGALPLAKGVTLVGIDYGPDAIQRTQDSIIHAKRNGALVIVVAHASYGDTHKTDALTPASVVGAQVLVLGHNHMACGMRRDGHTVVCRPGAFSRGADGKPAVAGWAVVDTVAGTVSRYAPSGMVESTLFTL